MPDYREMYRVLFQEITRAIAILQEAQRRTEALYMEDEGEGLILLEETTPKKEEHHPVG